MKVFRISCQTVQSDHIFASPEEHDFEFVEAEQVEDLYERISKRKDLWGHPYLVCDPIKDKFVMEMGFKFKSHQGGVKIEKIKNNA